MRLAVRPIRLGALLAALLLLPAVGARGARSYQPPVNVQVSNDSYAAHSEPMLAQNPVDPMNLVGGSKFFTDPRRYRFRIGTFVSDDGGASWRDNGPLPGFGAWPKLSDITIAFAPSGNIVYACVLVVRGRTSGIYVSRSFDRGHTWVAPVRVYLDRSGATFSDKPWITVDGTRGPHRGSVYVAWNLDRGSSANGESEADTLVQPVAAAPAPRSPVGVVVARSTDRGRTFSPPITLTRFTPSAFALGATPVVAPNGRVFVAFLWWRGRGRARRYDIGLAESFDGGRRFNATHAIVRGVRPVPNHLPNGTFRNFSLPAFAVSPTDGTLLVAWTDMRRGDADIFKSVSRDGGRTWSIPARINDPPGDGVDQFQPQLAAAADGSFSAMWFDRRYAAGNRLIDVAVARSGNDGRTFGPNLRVTARSWDPAIDAPQPEGRRSNTFIGDYQGLTADSTALHPFWNDTQNGRTQEIRTETVPLSMLTAP